MTTTSIEWVRGSDGSDGLSWNALRAEREIERKGKTITVSAHHCEHVNEACRFCYAESLNPRLGGLDFKPGHRFRYRFTIDHEKLIAPLKRRKPTRIFVESMSDAFGEWWPTEFIDKLYAVMALTPQHTYINLSKRPERRRQYLDDPLRHNAIELAAEKVIRGPEALGGKHILPRLPFGNIIEGTSVSDQPEADDFIPVLLRTKAALRIVSCEPLLGPINLKPWLHPFGCTCGWGGNHGADQCQGCGDVFDGGCSDTDSVDCPKCGEPTNDDTCPECRGERGEYGPNAVKLDGVIAGGESGHRARPMNPEWARSLRDQCLAADVKFFFKQWGEFSPHPKPSDDPYPGLQTDVVHFQKDGFGPYTATVYRVGKKIAGRLLDGIEHNGFPCRAPQQLTMENAS